MSNVDTTEIGQLFITGIKGVSLTSDEEEFIKNNNIGGVILFKYNYESPAQVAELVNQIQSLRGNRPLFISVDQEGGRVIRFSEPFTRFPPMLEIAKLKSPKICFDVHQILASELYQCGVNLCFSPVCDVLTNPTNKVIGDRSFGKDALEVEKFVSAAIRGLQSVNMISVAKHFPGHGGTTKDSHFDLPLIKKSLDDIKKEDLIPFYKASKSRVDMIMMAHLLVDALDENLPTSLSPKAYEFLRSELKFEKIIVTDDMEMKAVFDRFTPEDAAEKALRAGADLLIYRTLDIAKKAYIKIAELCSQDKSFMGELAPKIERIHKCKDDSLPAYDPIYVPSISSKIASTQTQVFMNDLAQKLADLKS